LADRALVTEFLRDKNIDVLASSPYRRAVDTVTPFAEQAGLQIEIIEDFREQKSSNALEKGEWGERVTWQYPYLVRQWADFTYKMTDGDSMGELQERNIRALNELLFKYRNKNIAVGTHGMALSAIINYYDATYGIKDFIAMDEKMPWVVVMDFDGNGGCVGMRKIDLFDYDPRAALSMENGDVRVYEAGSLGAYRFAVIFARYRGKWLYCRGNGSDVYETAGGHVEDDETVLEAAKRELYEETGALEFDIKPLFDYAVHFPDRYSNGQVFLAEVREIGEIPDYEMAEVGLFDALPDRLRFSMITPVLFQKVVEMAV
jgi:2,3-bisphosphoglycerate-dependent phosphoglycerate mutase